MYCTEQATGIGTQTLGRHLKRGVTAKYPATWVNLFLHMSRSLKICAQVES